MIVLGLESLPWCSNMDQTLVTNCCSYCNLLLEVIVLGLECLPWCSNMDQTLVTNSCSYCNIFTSSDTIGAGESALVFKHGPDSGD